jgi:hypothetical protein
VYVYIIYKEGPPNQKRIKSRKPGTTQHSHGGRGTTRCFLLTKMGGNWEGQKHYHKIILQKEAKARKLSHSYLVPPRDLWRDVDGRGGDGGYLWGPESIGTWPLSLIC